MFSFLQKIAFFAIRHLKCELSIWTLQSYSRFTLFTVNNLELKNIFNKSRNHKKRLHTLLWVGWIFGGNKKSFIISYKVL